MTRDKSILIKNIYYMLSYAFQTLNQGEYESIGTEKFDKLHNLFAAILSKGIGRQIKQGLYREYHLLSEDLPTLRGKIDMQATARNLIARKHLLTCEFDDLTENNLLNQILKTTVMLLIRHSEVDDEYKADLKKEMLFFSTVDEIDPTTIKWNSIRFHRNSGSYRMLISFCQLIIEGMLLTTENGEYKLVSFIDGQRMSRLYEKFILEYYIKEHPEIKTSSSQIEWALDDGVGTLLPVMQSDIMLSCGNKILIIDAKYYTHTMQSQYEVQSFHSSNLYQIFTYVKNEAELKKDCIVSGMLLYARTDESVQPDVSYQISGNIIAVKTLDLNKDFFSISKQLDLIAKTIL